MAWETVLTIDANQKTNSSNNNKGKKQGKEEVVKIALRGMHYSAQAGGLVVLNGVAKKGSGEMYLLRNEALRQQSLQLSDLVKVAGMSIVFFLLLVSTNVKILSINRKARRIAIHIS
jgi:hypothetical protein